MAAFDMKSDLNFTRGANLTVENNTQNSDPVDMQGWESLTVVCHTGAVTASGADINFKLQHSDTTADGDFEDVPSAGLIGAADPVDDNADDNLIKGTIGYVGDKRYVRLSAVGSAAADAVVFGVYVRGRSHSRPVDPVGAVTSTT